MPARVVGQDPRPRGEHVDDAVHGAGAIHGRSRAAQHLDGAGLLVVDLEHLVEVAEADRPDGQIVFGDEECAAAARAGQHRRADAAQALCAAASLNVDAGDFVERLGLMFGARVRRALTVDARHAGRRSERARASRVAVTTTVSPATRPEVGSVAQLASSSAAFAPSGSIATR